MFLWDLAFHKNIFLFYADNLGAYFTFTPFLVFTVTSTSGILGKSGIPIAPIQFQYIVIICTVSPLSNFSAWFISSISSCSTSLVNFFILVYLRTVAINISAITVFSSVFSNSVRSSLIFSAISVYSSVYVFDIFANLSASIFLIYYLHTYD